MDIKEQEKLLLTILLNALREYEVTPPEEYKTGKPKRMYWGLCHKKAFDYMVDLKRGLSECTYCCQGYITHPSPITTDKPLVGGHSWVEIELPSGTIIFDGVLQRFYNKTGYETALKADAKARMTIREFSENLLKYNTYGMFIPEEDKIKR